MRLSREAGRGRAWHVGYSWWTGAGQLEALTGFRPRPGLALLRWALRHPNVVFGGGVLVGTLAALWALLWLAGWPDPGTWPLVLLLALIPANNIAVSTVNQLITAFFPPHVLPKLDLTKSGVPADLATAVVVPTLFGGVQAVTEALSTWRSSTSPTGTLICTSRC